MKNGARRSSHRLPELPEARRARMVTQYGITEYDAATLTSTRSLADQFEEAASAAKNPKRVANLVQSELMGRLKAQGPGDRAVANFNEGRGDVGRFGGERRHQRKDTERPLRSRLRTLTKTSPRSTRRKSRSRSPTRAAIEKIIDEVIAANPKQLEQYRGGKKTVIAFFVGQVMKASKGQANPALVNELLAKKLDGAE